MSVEIGQLILRGTFGAAPSRRDEVETQAELRAAIDRMRDEIMDEVQHMIRDAARRQWER